jgi:hypothetical protein
MASTPSTLNPMTEEVLGEMRHLIWPGNLTEGDTNRWHQQGINFSEYQSSRFGLFQTQGGESFQHIISTLK